MSVVLHQIALTSCCFLAEKSKPVPLLPLLVNAVDSPVRFAYACSLQPHVGRSEFLNVAKGTVQNNVTPGQRASYLNCFDACIPELIPLNVQPVLSAFCDGSA